MAVVNIVGGFLGLGTVRGAAQWLYLSPLMAALVLATGLRTARSRWWLVGLLRMEAGRNVPGRAQDAWRVARRSTA